MASMALHIVHPKFGMASASFSFSDFDMDRIMRALNALFIQEVKVNPQVAGLLKDVVISNLEELNPTQVITILGEMFVQDLLRKVIKNEAERIYAESIAQVKQLQITNRS